MISRAFVAKGPSFCDRDRFNGSWFDLLLLDSSNELGCSARSFSWSDSGGSSIYLTLGVDLRSSMSCSCLVFFLGSRCPFEILLSRTFEVWNCLKYPFCTSYHPKVATYGLGVGRELDNRHLFVHAVSVGLQEHARYNACLPQIRLTDPRLGLMLFKKPSLLVACQWRALIVVFVVTSLWVP